MYSVALAWACICLWAFFTLPETPGSTSSTERESSTWREPRRRRETTLVVASLLLCLTHYTGLFFLAGLGAAWLVIAWSARRPMAPLVRWGILVAVGVGAWLPAIFLQRGRKLAMDAARDASLGVDPAAAGGLDVVGWAVGAADNIASILGVFPASSTAVLGLLALPFLLLLASGDSEAPPTRPRRRRGYGRGAGPVGRDAGTRWIDPAAVLSARGTRPLPPPREGAGDARGLQAAPRCGGSPVRWRCWF